jgi:hypothetical protein
MAFFYVKWLPTSPESVNRPMLDLNRRSVNEKRLESFSSEILLKTK